MNTLTAENQYKSVTNWQDQIFTEATVKSCAAHLYEECVELLDAITAGVDIESEIADCFLLLYGVCNKYGLSHSDILRIIDEKMEINKQRKWGSVNDKGYVKHIK